VVVCDNPHSFPCPALTLLHPVLPQVKALNGTKVQNMQHLVQLVDCCEQQYLHFDLDYNQKVRAARVL